MLWLSQAAIDVGAGGAAGSDAVRIGQDVGCGLEGIGADVQRQQGVPSERHDIAS